MDTQFKDVKVLIWDFDKTFYKPNAQLEKDIREAEYRVIMEHAQWDRTQAEAAFSQVYPSTYQSATEAVAHITQITTAQAAAEMENYFDRTKYLVHDERLIVLFRKLNAYEHYILMNGYRARVIGALNVLGIRSDLFREIITSETVGVNKPNHNGFAHILQSTKLPANHHLMIGDRITVDLAPAKRLGMKTCWVYWNTALHETDDSVVDICVPTVYDLEQVLV